MTSDGPITQEEMIELFGSEMPMEAVRLVYEAPDDWTCRDVRMRLREIAEERQKAAPLKPCPFCDGNASIERKGTARASMIIACDDCGARVESGDVWGLTHADEWRWNRRRAGQGGNHAE